MNTKNTSRSKAATTSPIKFILPIAFTLAAGISHAVTIDTVYFAQTHVQEANHPYLNLVGNRDTLIKAHVIDPAMPNSPAVSATLTLDGQTLILPLTGPAKVPASIPNGPGVVQHSFANAFTAVIPKAWVKSGLSVTVTAGTATSTINNLGIGAPTKLIMTMFDVQYFADTNGDYPAGWEDEVEAKLPVSEMEVRRVNHVVFPQLVIPPRSGAPAARVKSKADYTALTGLPFDGEQGAALAWNGALKAAAGRNGRVSLYAINLYGVGAGGQGGGFGFVGNGTGLGIFHHELGHALSLPHWGDSTSYPYKGDMHGIIAPVIYNDTHAGPTWGYDLRKKAFIPCTVQPGNVSGKPVGTYKVDPMQGGGSGYQEPAYLLNHFSDFSNFKMRGYLEGHVVVWNAALGKFCSWNATSRAYTTAVTNNGVSFPLQRDQQVIAVMASISGANPDVNMAYPPIGPFNGGLIRLFDPTNATDRTDAKSIFSPAAGSDLCMRVTQGGVVKTYMLAASWDTSADPLLGSSLQTAALNLPASAGSVTKIDLLLTPNAETNGLPANPEVLYSWPSTLTDVTKPTLPGSGFVDNRAGVSVEVGTPVSYTVTFSEDMDAASVSAADIGNAGTAAISIGAVTETSPNSGVFTLEVTPSTTGTLQLRVNAGAVLKDLAGNAMLTTAASADDTMITVRPINIAPIATAQSITTTEDAAKPIALTATDANSDPLAYSIVASPANGTLSGTAPNITYTPAANYNGSDSFTFRVNDGYVNSATATVTISVTAVNDTPSFSASSYNFAATEDAAFTRQLTASDVDAGDTLTFSKISGPAWLTVSTTGALSGTPGNAEVGSDAFSVSVRDSANATDTATLNIVIANVNDAPVFTSTTLTRSNATVGTAYSGQTLAGSATDVDAGDSLAYAKSSGPAWLIVDASGALSGTPTVGEAGAATFTVRATDASGASASATLNLTVNLLPLPWQALKIGTTNLNGAVVHNNGAFTVTGSGLWANPADTGYFLYQSLTGDGQITARVKTLQNTSSSRVGVMIRNTLAGNSGRVYMGMESVGDYRWGFRLTDGSTTNGYKSGSGSVPNTWIRITRTGNSFVCAKSPDGVIWTTAGTVSATYAPNCYIGIWISSGSDTTSNTSTFDNISVTP